MKKDSGVLTPPKKKVKGLRSHFKQENDTTNASRERSLTIDTRLDTEDDRRHQSSSELIEGINPFIDKPKSLGFQTAER